MPYNLEIAIRIVGRIATRSRCMSVYDSYKNTIKFKLFYIFVTPLCDIIRAHSPHPVYALVFVSYRLR